MRRKYMTIHYEDNGESLWIDANGGWYRMDIKPKSDIFTPQIYFRHLVPDTYRDKKHGIQIKSTYKYKKSEMVIWQVTLIWGDITKDLYTFEYKGEYLPERYIDENILNKAEKLLKKMSENLIKDVILFRRYCTNDSEVIEL